MNGRVGRRLAAAAAALLVAAGVPVAARVATGDDPSGGRSTGVRSARAHAAELAAAREASAPLPSGYTWRTLTVDGTRRRFLLYVPPHLTGPAPLVVGLHGLSQSAGWMARHTGLPAAARRSRVVLALPQSVAGAWNDGRLGPRGPGDEAFVLGLVQSLEAQRGCDPRRVTVAGFSNGAEMSLVLASRHPAVFAAVVAVSGQLFSAPGSPRPTAPVPAFFTHGTGDTVNPYAGRGPRGRLRPALLSEDATVAAFVAADGAGVPTSAVVVPGGRRGPRVTQTVWPAGPTGAEVVLYRLLGVGHVWPGAALACSQVVCAGGLDDSALVMRVALTHERAAPPD